MSESPDTQAEAVLPHSRACRFVKHDHGSDCHTNCPTCGGQTAYSPSAEPDGEAQYVPGPEFNECIREDCPAFHVVWGERNYFQGHPPKGIHVTPPCGSCGEPSIHRITLRGEPMPVCLRHLNHWRTPGPAQDGAEVEALAREWALAYARTYWQHGQEPETQAALTLLAQLAQRDKDRDAAVAAKVAEHIAQAIEAHDLALKSMAGQLGIWTEHNQAKSVAYLDAAAIARAAAPEPVDDESDEACARATLRAMATLRSVSPTAPKVMAEIERIEAEQHAILARAAAPAGDESE